MAKKIKIQKTFLISILILILATQLIFALEQDERQAAKDILGNNVEFEEDKIVPEKIILFDESAKSLEFDQSKSSFNLYIVIFVILVIAIIVGFLYYKKRKHN